MGGVKWTEMKNEDTIESSKRVRGLSEGFVPHSRLKQSMSLQLLVLFGLGFVLLADSHKHEIKAQPCSTLLHHSLKPPKPKGNLHTWKDKENYGRKLGNY